MHSIDEKAIKQAFEELDSNIEKQRSRAFNYLLPISQKHPDLLYPFWETLIHILQKEQVSNPYVAIPLIANLTRVDKDNKFEGVFDLFYSYIDHESPVVSPHIAGNSGIIINAKPHLAEKILDILLTTDEHSQCRHRGLLKYYVITALGQCYNTIRDKARVIDYVNTQLNSDSPKTRKLAKTFLTEHKNI